MPITNKSPDNGQPCLTPRSTKKNSDANPLLRTQLETLLYKILTQFLMFGPKIEFFKAGVNKIPFNGIKGFSEVYK